MRILNLVHIFKSFIIVKNVFTLFDHTLVFNYTLVDPLITT